MKYKFKKALKSRARSLEAIFVSFQKKKTVRFEKYFLLFLIECTEAGHDVIMQTAGEEVSLHVEGKTYLYLTYNILKGRVVLTYLKTGHDGEYKFLQKDRKLPNKLMGKDSKDDCIVKRFNEYLRIVFELLLVIDPDLKCYGAYDVTGEHIKTLTLTVNHGKGKKIYRFSYHIDDKRPFAEEIDCVRGSTRLDQFPQVMQDICFALGLFLDEVNKNTEPGFDVEKFEAWATKHGLWDIKNYAKNKLKMIKNNSND